MSMLDTVHHAGLEWLTKSTVPHTGGMAGDLAIKDGRLLLMAGEDTDSPTDAQPKELQYHGILELFRNLPSDAVTGAHRCEHKRLIFGEGQLLSETPANEDTQGDTAWQSDWSPTDPTQNAIWQLHTLRGMLVTLDAQSLPSGAAAALKQAEASISEALTILET